MKWTYFFILVAFQLSVSLPYLLSSCRQVKNPRAIIIWFIHHLFDVFLFWGPLFATLKYEYLAHLLLVFGVVIHWITNNYRCVITVMLNKMCGWPENQWLDSLLNRTALRTLFEYWQYIWLGALILLDVVKIMG